MNRSITQLPIYFITKNTAVHGRVFVSPKWGNLPLATCMASML
ncbi:MAG TPA: hypothetical protein PLD25_17645 [Chloroflexota bacterium]|nr:hypothetical protein [Chloroflexota bacterium]HUM72134.1 hypothetical protein [Chloroflexota bacterium]